MTHRQEDVERAARAMWNAGFGEKDDYDSLDLHSQLLAQDMVRAAINKIEPVIRKGQRDEDADILQNLADDAKELGYLLVAASLLEAKGHIGNQ